MSAPRIIATAEDLVSVGNSCRPETPVVMTAAEIEPGADPHADTWVVAAAPGVMALNDDGGIAAPGEPRAIITDMDETGVIRRVATVPVLRLCARQVRIPGQLGPDAFPADRERHRVEALNRPDGDMTSYLMWLQHEVTALREEIQEVIGAAQQPFAPPAVRRLEHVIDALDGARLELADALPYGDVCELSRLGVVDDDESCPPRLGDVLVWLPDAAGSTQGQVQPGCAGHAAIAVRTVPNARVMDTAG